MRAAGASCKSSNENPALKAGENSAAALRKSSNKNPCFESWSEHSWPVRKLKRKQNNSFEELYQ
jgi:hypothetical protein